MRLIAFTVLVVGNLLANQVQAEDISPQPLTRIDCDKAAMAWDENANVCGAAWGQVWDQRNGQSAREEPAALNCQLDI